MTMPRDIVKQKFYGLLRLLRGGVEVSKSSQRQIEDAPYQTFENGFMRPMRKEDYLRIDEMKRRS